MAMRIVISAWLGNNARILIVPRFSKAKGQFAFSPFYFHGKIGQDTLRTTHPAFPAR